MANQLTKQVMATIVQRCSTYEPLEERPSPSSGGAKSVGIKANEEALLSSVIHRQAQTYQNSDFNRQENSSRPVSPTLSKNGVVNLDALLKELKK